MLTSRVEELHGGLTAACLPEARGAFRADGDEGLSVRGHGSFFGRGHGRLVWLVGEA